MRFPSLLSLPVALVAVASCSSSGSAPPPAAAPAPAAAAAPASGRAAGAGGTVAAAPTQAGGRAGAPAAAAGGRGGRGAGPTAEQRQARADSIAAVRAETVRELMTTINGKENQPAGQVFHNVQLMKDVPAREFLIAMDQGIGRGTGHGCTDCHVVNDWASDSLPRKKTARIMMGVVHDINTSLLPRMGPGPGGRPRTISCLTCHRGGRPSRDVTIP